MGISILADQHIYCIREWCPFGAKLRTFDSGENNLPENITEEALLVRTVSKINAYSLPVIPPNLKMIASASAGTDHVDLDFLKENGIYFSHAAGCNARAVAEYVISALIVWEYEKKKSLKNMVIGIVGVGATGSAVNSILMDAGLKTMCYDPPREARDSSFKSVSKEELLSCDILTFHLPYTSSGKHKTAHWLNENILKKNSYSLIIQTSRGGVIDERALLDSLKTGWVESAIIDVWEGEPALNHELARCAFLTTPHIAGYSIQAKEKATTMVIRQCCEFFDIPEPAFSLKPPSKIPDISDSHPAVFLKKNHSQWAYHAKLQQLISKGMNSGDFLKLRTTLPLEDECFLWDIPEALISKNPLASALFRGDD